MILDKNGKAVNHSAEKTKESNKYFCSDLESTSMIHLTVIRIAFYLIDKSGNYWKPTFRARKFFEFIGPDNLHPRVLEELTEKLWTVNADFEETVEQWRNSKALKQIPNAPIIYRSKCIAISQAGNLIVISGQNSERMTGNSLSKDKWADQKINKCTLLFCVTNCFNRAMGM